MFFQVTAKATLYTSVCKEVDILTDEFEYIYRPPSRIAGKFNQQGLVDFAKLAFKEHVRGKFTLKVGNDVSIQRQIENIVSRAWEDVGDNTHYTFVNQTKIRFDDIKVVINMPLEIKSSYSVDKVDHVP